MIKPSSSHLIIEIILSIFIVVALVIQKLNKLSTELVVDFVVAVVMFNSTSDI